MAIHQGRRALELVSTSALLIALLAQAPAASAQVGGQPRPDLFGANAAADVALDAEQTARMARYRADPAAVAVTIVRIATEELTRRDGVKLTIGARPAIALDRLSLSERSARSYSWHARGVADVGDNPRDVSEATLVVDGASVVGTIRAQGELYRIRPLGGGLSALIQVDQSRMPPEHPPGFASPPEIPPGDLRRDGATAGDECGSYNLMVAYTAAARSQAGDIDGLIQLAVDETNQGYAASGAGTRINLVHRYQTSYGDSGNMSTDLSRFTSKGDGAADEVHGLRDEYGADVALLLTGSGGYCGVAWLYPGAESAFGVVAQNCATGYYSFAHEIGHIQGARHNPEIDPGTTPFTYGHGYYYQPERWRTIMSYDCPGGCDRLNHWSNPTKTHDGVPLGTSAVSDNTRVLNTTACRVANFRSGGGGGGGPGWKSWESLLAGVVAAPECIATGSSQIDCLAVRSGARVAWSRWNGTAWSTWADLGGATASAPSCVQSGGRLSCFIVSTSGELQQSILDGDTWTGWVGRGGALRRQPSCLAFGSGGIECFALGGDSQVWQVSFDGTTWLMPSPLGGSAGQRPSCYARGAGIDCYIRDKGYRMRVKRYTGAAWGTWSNVGGSVQSPLSCVYLGATTQCFGRGRDNTLQAVAHDGTRWGAWSSLGGTLAGEPSCLPLGGAGKLACVAPSTSGGLLDKRFDGTGWGAFADIGGGIIQRVATVPLGDNRVEVFARGSDGSLRHNAFY